LADSGAVGAGAVSGLHLADGTALYFPLVIGVMLAIAFLIARTFSKLGGSVRRAGDPWLCGYGREVDCYRYNASHFYIEITRHFNWLGCNPRPKARIEAVVKEK
jgi:hypothetical protein